MIENSILPAGGVDQYTITCSLSGRVLEISRQLRALLELDIVGRNLNDIVEDSTAANIIRKSDEDSVFEFDCAIAGKNFLGGSQISQSGRIVIVLNALLKDEGKKAAGSELLRYAGREMNRNAESINAAIAMLDSRNEEQRRLARAMMKRSVMNLARVSRNVVARADYEEGSIIMSPRCGDILSEVRSLFAQIREFCAGEAIISYECPEDRCVCWYDSTALGKVILNLVGHSILKAGNDTPRIILKAEIKDEGLVIQVAASFDLEASGTPSYGDDIETDIIALYVRKMQGSFVMSSAPGMGCSYRVTLPVVTENTDGDVMSSPVIDWYGGMDRVAYEFSGALSSERYTDV